LAIRVPPTSLSPNTTNRKKITKKMQRSRRAAILSGAATSKSHMRAKPMRVLKRQTVFHRTFLFCAVVALNGCSLNVDPSGPASIIIVSGTPQSAPVNTALPAPFTVVVVGQFLEPLAGETVTWSVVAPGSGTLNPLTSVTDINGYASTTYTTGATAGAVQVQAKHAALPAVYFNVTVNP
jgi:hypothetical protein